MKKVLTILTFVIVILIPFNAFASLDFSDSLYVPPNDIADFSSYLNPSNTGWYNKITFIIYNGDGNYYLFRVSTYSNSAEPHLAYGSSSGDTITIRIENLNKNFSSVKVYSIANGGSTWAEQTVNSTSINDVPCYIYVINKPVRVVYSTYTNLTWYDYNVANQPVGYAMNVTNLFSTDGTYIGPSGGSGTPSGGSGSVDLTYTNSLISQVKSSIDTVNNTLSNTINSSLSTINTSMNNMKTSLETKLDSIIDAITAPRSGNTDVYSMLYFINNGINSLSSIINDNFNQLFDDYLTPMLDFFDYFPTMLDTVIMECWEKIDNQINPTSEDNQEAFDESLNNLYDNTFVGSVKDLSDSGTQLATSISNTSPNSHIYVNTIAVRFFGINIPAKQIDIDMSWYSAYRVQVFSILRAFIYIGYLILVIRNAPSILGSASPLMAQDVPLENVTLDSNGSVIEHTTVWQSGNTRFVQRNNVRGKPK